ncbi:site-specific DNA-methyltransferase [Candidatus Saccharibacteria bacterium]|nr:site-specific DNA-methyltransferase [Candidatus Saccharibacteria bacterium]
MTPEKMDGTSLDIAEQRRRELQQLFPGVFTETTGTDGRSVQTIDFERLKAELGTFSDVYEGRRERYGMEWPGKRDCMKLIQEPSRATLKPCREESVDFDTTQNLFIEGDNLEVLKLLQKSYYGKVKMIYIDPPYNTGKEFIYPDKYSESLETYLAYAGLVDDEGKKFSTNTATEGRYHTKWLNMMYPRLYLSRNLLRDDGVIFISIDDNEVENLRRLCNEIFGEENFIASIIWQRVYSPKNSARYFSEDHDYVLVYCRNAESWRPNLIPRSEEALDRYKNFDNDPRGPWKASDLTARNYYGEGTYEVVGPTGKKFEPTKGMYWRVSKDNFQKLDQDNRIWWGPDKDSMPAQKRFLSEVKDGVVPQTLWKYTEVGHTQEAKKELLEFVSFENTENVLNSVKPTRLIRKMLVIGTEAREDDIVLDFFAGSAPTAHAIMAQNAEDGGNRRYILVQLQEPLKTEEPNAKTICDLGKSRIRNVADALKEDLESKGAKSKGESDRLDLGVKVFRLDKSAFQQWQNDLTEPEDISLDQKLDLYVDHIEQGATQEEILQELLLKAGFMATDRVENLVLDGKQVFSIANGALLVCLEDELTSALIDAVADREPMQFICLDKSFKGNDQLKANAVQSFKSRSQGAETEMVFKVV